MKKLRSGDPVQVITGKYKGKISSIEKTEEEKVWVKGVNEVKKAVKGKGFVKKHLPINISNVMYYDESTKAPSKLAIKITKEGKKVRVIKKTDKEIK
ncbi:MAG: 50S ribosomal protein L24 [Candidatus Absconditabacteria bacterium]